MKKLGQISLFIASLLVFPTLSFAEWREVASNVNATYYVHIESIRKTDGYVYFWELGDLVKPLSSGARSVKLYNQTDCKQFRAKKLEVNFYKEPLGEGDAEKHKPEPEWYYPKPESSFLTIVKFVCNFVK